MDEEILSQGELTLVALNTRVPRYVSKAINQATGFMQSEHTNLTYTKQATVIEILKRGLRDYFEELDRLDQEHLAQSEKVIPMPTQSTQSEPSKPSKHRTFDIGAYYSMSNKVQYEPNREPQSVAHNASKNTLQSKLGLK